MGNTQNDQLMFNGKPVDGLTREELKKALVLTNREKNKYMNLYFRTLDEKADLISAIINLKLEELKHLTSKNL